MKKYCVCLYDDSDGWLPLDEKNSFDDFKEAKQKCIRKQKKLIEKGWYGHWGVIHIESDVEIFCGKSVNVRNTFVIFNKENPKTHLKYDKTCCNSKKCECGGIIHYEKYLFKVRERCDICDFQKEIILHCNVDKFVEVIEESKSLLELKDGWDGKHSKGYLLKTWNRAINFLIDLSEKYSNTYNSYIDIPFIDGGMKGNIDIHWKTKIYELFLTVPEDDSEGLSYYGDDYKKKNVIEGIAEIGKYNDIIGFIGKLREVDLNE